MLEVNLKDGNIIYIPLARVVEISQEPDGYVVSTSDASGKPQWHNATMFAILREGQRVTK